jgi:hypothetical protein
MHCIFFLNLDCCQYNRKLAVACGLVSIPCRRTFDRRLKTMSTDIKQRISTMGYLFASEGIVMVDDDHSIATAVDSTLMKAKGSVWHKSSMKKGIIPCSGIDTDARWGYSHTKGWLFGYKLHLTCTTGDLIVPLTADVTTANIQDNQMFITLVSSSSSSSSSSLVFSLPSLLYMIADPGYDDKKLYEYSKKALGMDLVCPLERYENTPKKRLELVCFYQSALGQAIYSRRRISIEPSLIEHIKSVFRLDPLPARGFHKVSSIVLLSVLLYQVMVYYNCKINKSKPLKSIKYLLGTC